MPENDVWLPMNDRLEVRALKYPSERLRRPSKGRKRPHQSQTVAGLPFVLPVLPVPWTVSRRLPRRVL